MSGAINIHFSFFPLCLSVFLLYLALLNFGMSFGHWWPFKDGASHLIQRYFRAVYNYAKNNKILVRAIEIPRNHTFSKSFKIHNNVGDFVLKLKLIYLWQCVVTPNFLFAFE